MSSSLNELGLVGDDLWVLAVCDCENGAAGDPKDLYAYHSRGSAQGNTSFLIQDGSKAPSDTAGLIGAFQESKGYQSAQY